jgi:hypothetical protein
MGKLNSTAPCVQLHFYMQLATHRPTLFITTMGCSPFCRAFPSTNLVCAIGPSVASTSSKHPSTMSRTRSTSPPKSACPGVSTALSTHARHGNDVYLDEMVMPRSLSSAYGCSLPAVRLVTWTYRLSSIVCVCVCVCMSVCVCVELQKLSVF